MFKCEICEMEEVDYVAHCGACKLDFMKTSEIEQLRAKLEEATRELELRDKCDGNISKNALESLYSENKEIRAKLENANRLIASYAQQEELRAEFDDSDEVGPELMGRWDNMQKKLEHDIKEYREQKGPNEKRRT